MDTGAISSVLSAVETQSSASRMKVVVEESRSPRLIALDDDATKYMLSFLSRRDIILFGYSCTDCLTSTAKYFLDRAREVAYHQDDGYHIEHISSHQKEAIKSKLDPRTMTFVEDGQQRHLLIPSRNQQVTAAQIPSDDEMESEREHSANTLVTIPAVHRFEWAIFIHKSVRGARFKQVRGYWKVLLDDTPYDDSKFIPRHDLDRIRSLVMHQNIASTLIHVCDSDDTLNKLSDSATRNVNPFKEPVTIHIDDREYEVSYWNGAREEQTSAFRIRNCSSGKTNYYQYFRTEYNSNIAWRWYDNNAAAYKPYSMGPQVDLSLECSLQANWICNYAASGKLFHNVFLPALRQAFMDEWGLKEARKRVLLRFGFVFDDEEDIRTRRISTVEQVTVSDHAFPRTVQRIDCDRDCITDFGGGMA